MIDVQSVSARQLVSALAATMGLLAVMACGQGAEPPAAPEAEPPPAQPSAPTSWLQGTTDERFEVVTRPLRGLDMAMVEIGYRYQELSRAGESENLDYAAYQVNKIRQSLENALQRRPRREASAREIFMPTFDAMTDAAASNDRSQFEAQLTEFTASCNRCHVAEGVFSFVVIPPAARTAPIQ